MNSREKGKRGEREFASFLRERGIEARRGQQFSGGNESPDVVHDLTGVHFEVKRQERWEPEKWYEQARRDAAEGEVPVVAMKKNRGSWMVLLDAGDLLALLTKRDDAPEVGTSPCLGAFESK